jgi:hypothetical protein
MVFQLHLCFFLNCGCVKTVTAEWNHVTEGEPGLTRLMESNKFTKTGLISNYYTREVVYVQNSFNIYREK